MATSVTLNPKGLYTNYNTISQVDPGALLLANNLVLDEMGTLTPRRGIKYYGSLFSNSAHRARQLLEYKGRIIRHVDNVLAFDDGTGVFTAFNGTYGDPTLESRIRALEFKGNLYFPTNLGVKKISAKNTGQINSSSIIDTGALTSAGCELSTFFTTTGFLGATQKTAYKVTWGYKDNNNILFEGVPSAAETISNNTALNSFGVSVKVLIPVDATLTTLFKIYRCEIRSNTSSLSDEFNQIYEGYPTAGELVAGIIEYDDLLSDDFRLAGLPLYSNPNSGTGANSVNYRPPYATDIALYQNHLFYANTKLAHFKTITLQSLSGFTSTVSDFVVDDGTTTRTYIFQGLPEISTINAQPFSFFAGSEYFLINSANNIRRYGFYIDKTGADPAPVHAELVGRIITPININGLITANQVAAAIASAVNAFDDFEGTSSTNIVTIENFSNGDSDAVADGTGAPTNLIFATFQQGLGEDLTLGYVLLEDSVALGNLPALDATARSLVAVINSDTSSVVNALYLGNGKILLQRTGFADLPFSTDSSDSNITSSFFPALSSTENLSEDSKSVNGLYFSKQDEPESVPLLNVVFVGSSDEPILRIVPLRESLYIFKSDGLFRLTGYDSSSFATHLFDSTAILKASDSAQVLSNQIYYYGTQGVGRVSEGGVESISGPIDDKILPHITTNSNLGNLVFSVAYETDGAYLLWTALKSSDTIAQVCYRYSTTTKSWVEWKIPKTCAVLNRLEDKLYFGNGAVATLEIERKSFDRFDAADREISVELPSLSYSGVIMKPTGASQMDAGDVIYQLQGVTVSHFNQLLTMLSVDPSYPVNTFLTLNMIPGDDINIKIAALCNYLNTIDVNAFVDTHGNTSYVFTSSTDFSVVQTRYFRVVDRINQSPSFFRSNYPKYNRLTPIEAVIQSRNISNNDIYLTHNYPFMQGVMLVYKAIITEVEYVPQGDPTALKQYHTAQVIFEHRSMNTAQVGFNSDLSTNFEYVQFYPNSAGTWGNFTWGTGAVWGGEGDRAPLRTYIPRNKQRCRMVGVRFKHAGALESYKLYGVSIYYNEISDKAYK